MVDVIANLNTGEIIEREGTEHSVERTIGDSFDRGVTYNYTGLKPLKDRIGEYSLLEMRRQHSVSFNRDQDIVRTEAGSEGGSYCPRPGAHLQDSPRPVAAPQDRCCQGLGQTGATWGNGTDMTEITPDLCPKYRCRSPGWPMT